MSRHRVALPVAGILLYGCLVAAVASPGSFSLSWLTTAQPAGPSSAVASLGRGGDAYTGRPRTATPTGNAESGMTRPHESVAASDSTQTATVQIAEAAPEKLVVHEQIPAPALSYRVSSDASYASTDGTDQFAGEQMPLPGGGGGDGSLPSQPVVLAGSPGGTLYPNTPPGTTPFPFVPFSSTPNPGSPSGDGGTPIAKTTPQDPPVTDSQTPTGDDGDSSTPPGDGVGDPTDPTGGDPNDPPIQVAEDPIPNPPGGDPGPDGPPSFTDPPFTDPVDVSQQIVQVPEPSTLFLILPAMLALLLLRRRRPAYARVTRR